MKKSMKNRNDTLNKKKSDRRTKKYRGGEILKYNPNFTSFAQIYNMEFDFPGPTTDYYKFLRYAKMDLVDAMRSGLHKEEMRELNVMTKYMYLIRAKNAKDKNNTIMHYICMNQSMNMLDVVLPFYLILHNKMFKELLVYYLNLENGDGYLPLDMLFLGGGVRGRSITKGFSATKKMVGNVATLNASGVVKQVMGMGKSVIDRAASKEPKKRIYCILTLFGAKFSEKFEKDDSKYKTHKPKIDLYNKFCKDWKKAPGNEKGETTDEKDEIDPNDEKMTPGPVNEPKKGEGDNITPTDKPESSKPK